MLRPASGLVIALQRSNPARLRSLIQVEDLSETSTPICLASFHSVEDFISFSDVSLFNESKFFNYFISVCGSSVLFNVSLMIFVHPSIITVAIFTSAIIIPVSLQGEIHN